MSDTAKSNVAVTTSKRHLGIDYARGLATLAMIQTHAYDGWVAPHERGSFAFAITRVIAVLALPTFMLLSGVSIALRAQAARARGETSFAVRREVARRGLVLVLTGYAYSAVCAFIDGGAATATLLRADILHAIGLSLVVLAFVGLRSSRMPSDTDMRELATRSALLAGAVLVMCPWLSLIARDVRGPARYVAALFVDVPGVTRMPLVPLVAWAALGVTWAVHVLLRERARVMRETLLVGMVCTLLGHAAFVWLTERMHLPIARTSFAIIPNALELVGRALLLVVLAELLVPHLRGIAAKSLRALGRHSLLIYALHLPFCYGRLAAPLSRSCSMLQATGALALLLTVCMLAALAREHFKSASGLLRFPSA